MKYLCRITESGTQKRITLPKEFIRYNQWEDAEYIIINDSDKRNIKLRRFNHGQKEETESS